MSIRTITPENRLAKALTERGGRTAEEMAVNARARLETLGEQLRASVEEHLAQIMAMQHEGDRAIRARSLELSHAALSIAEVAGAAGLRPLGEAARGLHAMLEGLLANGLWHAEATTLHIAALGLLSAPDAVGPADVDLVLARLQAMRAAIGVPE
jgi:hypothetical protein